MRYVDVILPLPLDGTFTYGVSTELAPRVQEGVRLLVPLGRSKRYTAIAVRLHDEAPEFEVRDVLEVLDDRPILLPRQLQLWQWISNYYMAPLGDVMMAALPAGLKNEEGYRPKEETYVGLSEPYRSEQALHIALDMLRRAEKQQKVLMDFLFLSGVEDVDRMEAWEPESAEVTREELMNESHCTAAVLKSLIDRKILYTYTKEVGRLNHGGEPHPEHIKKLSDAQETAYNKVLLQFMRKQVVLLHGVTSSGKTEIYIHLIQRELDAGRQVLYLLPEIALTVQMMERLRAVFGNRLGIYHSRYSDAERVEIWQKQLSRNPYDIILGARSAVFLPRTRDVVQAAGPSSALPCPQRGRDDGGRCRGKGAARHCHALHGDLPQRTDREIRTRGTHHALSGHRTARDTHCRRERPAPPQDDERPVFATTAGSHAPGAGRRQAGHPVPEPSRLCTDDRV